jgi:hypothetical protein
LIHNRKEYLSKSFKDRLLKQENKISKLQKINSSKSNNKN